MVLPFASVVVTLLNTDFLVLSSKASDAPFNSSAASSIFANVLVSSFAVDVEVFLFVSTILLADVGQGCYTSDIKGVII